MNKDIEEQTDALECIISEVTKVNELVYAGWSVESLSRGVTKDNIEDMQRSIEIGCLSPLIGTQRCTYSAWVAVNEL